VPLIVPIVALPPAIPLTLQTTAMFVVPVTVALNSFVFPTEIDAVDGDTVTLTGCGAVTITDATPCADGVWTLVASTVTLAAAEGTLYNPF
jgi:hypothetical protein